MLYRNTYMEVYLDNIKYNVEQIIKQHSNYKYYFGVVKADCYGHYSNKVVNKIIEALEDNKAHRIVKIDLRKIENCFCSFFVICHGTSGTHIAGLTDAVEEKVREDLDERPFQDRKSVV